MQRKQSTRWPRGGKDTKRVSSTRFQFIKQLTGMAEYSSQSWFKQVADYAITVIRNPAADKSGPFMEEEDLSVLEMWSVLSNIIKGSDLASRLSAMDSPQLIGDTPVLLWWSQIIDAMFTTIAHSRSANFEVAALCALATGLIRYCHESLSNTYQKVADLKAAVDGGLKSVAQDPKTVEDMMGKLDEIISALDDLSRLMVMPGYPPISGQTDLLTLQTIANQHLAAIMEIGINQENLDWMKDREPYEKQFLRYAVNSTPGASKPEDPFWKKILYWIGSNSIGASLGAGFGALTGLGAGVDPATGAAVGGAGGSILDTLLKASASQGGTYKTFQDRMYQTGGKEITEALMKIMYNKANENRRASVKQEMEDHQRQKQVDYEQRRQENRAERMRDQQKRQWQSAARRNYNTRASDKRYRVRNAFRWYKTGVQRGLHNWGDTINIDDVDYNFARNQPWDRIANYDYI